MNTEIHDEYLKTISQKHWFRFIWTVVSLSWLFFIITILLALGLLYLAMTNSKRLDGIENTYLLVLGSSLILTSLNSVLSFFGCYIAKNRLKVSFPKTVLIFIAAFIPFFGSMIFILLLL